MNLIIRLLLNASVFLLVSRIVPGFQVASLWTAVWAALIFGFVNALIRPILLAISLPLSILTIGPFTLVVDAAVMALTAWLVPGFDVSASSQRSLVGSWSPWEHDCLILARRQGSTSA